MSNIDTYRDIHIKMKKTSKLMYSNYTIDKIYRLINKTFKIAVSDRIIQFNPMDNESISKPKSKILDKEIEALSLEGQRKLVQALFVQMD